MEACFHKTHAVEDKCGTICYLHALEQKISFLPVPRYVSIMRNLCRIDIVVSLRLVLFKKE